LSTRIALLLILAIPILIASIWFVSQAGAAIVLGLQILWWLLVSTIGACLIFSVVGLIWKIVQRGRLEAAQAKQAERDANVLIITAGPNDQVITTDGINFVKRHIDPRIVAPDHKMTPPTPMDLTAQAAWLASQSPRQTAALPAPDTAWNVARPLLEAIADMERGLIVGGSGSGKTTLLQHIIARRPGDVLVIDPHDDTNTWPGNAQVVGGGQDYQTIESALAQFTHQVRDRYRERHTSQGQAQFAPLMLVFDEWFEVFKHVDSAPSNMQTVLTGGRKINTYLVIGSHSERVKPLGLDGAGDLKNGFYVVRLGGDQATGFSATLDTGDGQQDVVLPGPYVPASGQVVNPQLPPPVKDIERRVLALHQAGKSITAIGEAVYGVKGGNQNELVREILRNNGVV